MWKGFRIILLCILYEFTRVLDSMLQNAIIQKSTSNKNQKVVVCVQVSSCIFKY